MLQSYKSHKTKLPLLEFKTKYSIGVRAQTNLQDGSVKESNQTFIEFTTQGCLEFYSRNLSVCSKTNFFLFVLTINFFSLKLYYKPEIS